METFSVLQRSETGTEDTDPKLNAEEHHWFQENQLKVMEWFRHKQLSLCCFSYV